MAKIKCRFCSKKIDDNLEVCPKCIVSKKNLKILRLSLLFFPIQSLLCCFLITFSKSALYSEKVNDLYILIFFSILILINSILTLFFVFKSKEKTIFQVVLGTFCILFSIFSLLYGFKVSNAFKYDNSKELKMLADNYELSVAKKIKSEIERIFEYDSEGVFSRDVIINNFYTDGKISNLYLADLYDNYSLKFYVDFDDFMIKNVSFNFGDYELVLVSDFNKTENFDFYYAMMITDKILGEDVKGVATLDKAIENELTSIIDISVNAMFNYENLEYNFSDNSFNLQGNVYNMDSYGNFDDKTFFVTFENNYECKKKHEWFYGDSSFDYVKWSVKI